MRWRLLIGLAGLVVVLVVAPSVGAVGAGGSARQPILGPQRISRGVTQSVNWAGYAVYNTSGATPVQFKDVSGSWQQPTGVCSKKSSTFAAFYVGLDGYTLAVPSAQSVEQIGTDADCSQGTPLSYAWYEMYPSPPVFLSMSDYPVKPGDMISAEVAYDSGSSFTLTLNNDCKCGIWPFSVTVDAPVTPQRATAQWIAEMPATGGHFWPLTNFGSISFQNASVTTDSGKKGSISNSNWQHDQIQLVQRGRGGAIACTGPLSANGKSFTISYGACPSP